MNPVYIKQKIFLTFIMIWVLFLSIALAIEDKVYWQILFNDNHNILADYFFKYYTWLGDGLLIVVFCLLLGFVRIRLAILTLSTYFISGLLAQLLKHFVFDHVFRPVHVLRQMGIDVLQVQDVALRSKFSFPSGHTTSAFAFFLAVSLIVGNKKRGLQILFFTMAALVGFSRIYLNLHFVNDVLFGSILGTVVTLGTYLLMDRMQYSWLDKSYLEFLKKK